MASHICHMNSPVDQSGQPFFCVEIEKKITSLRLCVWNLGFPGENFWNLLPWVKVAISSKAFKSKFYYVGPKWPTIKAKQKQLHCGSASGIEVFQVCKILNYLGPKWPFHLKPFGQ